MAWPPAIPGRRSSGSCSGWPGTSRTRISRLWNEVYVKGRWVAVDATFAQTQVDAVHIKLSESSLDGLAPFEAFLPVVRVLGKMTIVPVETR
jgi:hypothetical protein